MTTTPPSEREFDELLDQLCEERISEEDWQRLVELLGGHHVLRVGEAHRRRYLDYIELHAALWSGGAARPHVSLPFPATQAPQEPPATPASPVLGFLGNMGRDGWPNILVNSISSYATLFSALAALFFVALILAAVERPDPRLPLSAY